MFVSLLNANKDNQTHVYIFLRVLLFYAFKHPYFPVSCVLFIDFSELCVCVWLFLFIILILVSLVFKGFD